MKLLIAGGGTGGHLFPGIALAEEVLTRQPNNDVLFVGTGRGLEATVVPREGYKLELIEVGGLKGVGPLKLLAGLLRLPKAFIQSMSILRRYRPDVVIGVGGYASGPVVLAAWLMGVPTAIQEQNALPGVTNRILGRLAKVVFTAFEEAGRFFPRRKVNLIGNPIRRAMMDNYLAAPTSGPELHLLVFGGSQGAHAVNMRVLEAMPHLVELKDRLRVLHQTGKSDLEAVRRGYESMGIRAEVKEFVQEMSQAYAWANLAVCRAGATTLAELTVCRKPAVLIPFPHAADNHQERNASALVSAGAAVMLRESELTGERLAKELAELIHDPARLQSMSRAAGRLGRPEAAKEIADVCAEMAKRRGGAGLERAR